jgi:hypothetical protein
MGLPSEETIPEVTQHTIVEAWVAASSSSVACTRTSNSPVNGFTSEECADILEQELDNLCGERSPKIRSPQRVQGKLSGESDPERNLKVDIDVGTRDSETLAVDRKVDEEQERWTLLDCCFGVPLFDAEANSQICDAIISTGLWRRESLEKLTASSRRLCLRLLDFIGRNQVIDLCIFVPFVCQDYIRVAYQMGKIVRISCTNGPLVESLQCSYVLPLALPLFVHLLVCMCI